MTVRGASPFVQNAFVDQIGLGLPGQQASTQAGYNNVVRGYSTESIVFCGRAVVKLTVQNFTNSDVANTQPFTIEAPKPASVIADLVGVVTRPYEVVQNYEDVDSIEKAGFGAKTVVSVLPFGSKQRIIVTQDTALGNVVHGAPVYVVIDAANSFGIQVGEFANAAAATPAHTLLVPNAIWYLTKNTATATDDVNIIELL